MALKRFVGLMSFHYALIAKVTLVSWVFRKFVCSAYVSISRWTLSFCRLMRGLPILTSIVNVGLLNLHRKFLSIIYTILTIIRKSFAEIIEAHKADGGRTLQDNVYFQPRSLKMFGRFSSRQTPPFGCLRTESTPNTAR